jgi:hypothetical protein
MSMRWRDEWARWSYRKPFLLAMSILLFLVLATLTDARPIAIGILAFGGGMVSGALLGFIANDAGSERESLAVQLSGGGLVVLVIALGYILQDTLLWGQLIVWYGIGALAGKGFST